jgi:hypothetical protein
MMSARLFHTATKVIKSSMQVFNDLQKHQNSSALQNAGFNMNFAANASASAVAACEELFTHKDGVEIYKELMKKDPDFLNNSPDAIQNTIAAKLNPSKTKCKNTDLYAEGHQYSLGR